MGREADYSVGMVFGLRTAIGLIALQWRYKEEALKQIQKEFKEALTEDPTNTIKAVLASINTTINDKVLKVLTQSMALFSLLIKSKELEEFGTDLLIKGILHYDLIHKIIQRSEDSNS